MPDLAPHVCISVGHRRNAQGAAYGGITEWLYNSTLALHLQVAYEEAGVDAVIVERPTRAVYRGKDKARVSPYMRQIEMVNATGALFAHDLHLNAAVSPHARGRLFLSSGSPGSLALCDAIRTEFNARVPGQDRGVEVRDVEENGGPFLHLTTMPACILEPWFLSNEDDRREIVWYQRKYVASIVAGGVKYLRAVGAIE